MNRRNTHKNRIKNTWYFCGNNTFLEINFTKISERRQCSNQNFIHIIVPSWIYIYCYITNYKKENSSQNSSDHLLSHNFHGLAECFWSSVSYGVESFDVSLVLVDLLWKIFVHMAVDSSLLHGNIVFTMQEHKMTLKTLRWKMCCLLWTKLTVVCCYSAATCWYKSAVWWEQSASLDALLCAHNCWNNY